MLGRRNHWIGMKAFRVNAKLVIGWGCIPRSARKDGNDPAKSQAMFSGEFDGLLLRTCHAGVQGHEKVYKDMNSLPKSKVLLSI